MTRDSVGNIKYTDPQTLNLYEYAEDNPVSNTDPKGTDVGESQEMTEEDIIQNNAIDPVPLSDDPSFIALSFLTGEGEAGEGVNFSVKALERMENPGRFVPVQTLMNCIEYGTAEADPQGSRAIMYTIEMFKNDVPYQLEVLYDKATNAIWHFVYKPI